MKLTFLGTGNAFAPRRDWNAVLVNEALLFDAGPSVLVNLKRLGLDPAAITHIFLSHFHGDHFFGLPFLLLEYHFLSRTSVPLAIVGPPGVEEKVGAVMTLAYPEVMEKGWPRPITFIDAVDGVATVAEGLSFTPIRLDHIPQLEAYGYRVELPDGIFAYSGDTGMTPALTHLLREARAVVLEACTQEESALHLGLRSLREILAMQPSDCRVFLSHLDAPDDEAWRTLPVTVPKDLESFEV